MEPMTPEQVQVCTDLKAVIRRASELGISIYTFEYSGWFGSGAGRDSDEAKSRSGADGFVGFCATSNVSEVYELSDAYTPPKEG